MKRSELPKRKTWLRSKRPTPRRKESPYNFGVQPVKSTPKYLDDDGVFRMPDGRERCDLNSKKGLDEYIRRKRVAWESQTFESIGIHQPGHYCSICKQILFWKDTTADHIVPRGMGGGSRNDVQANIAAAHLLCNQQKGSKRIDLGDDFAV